MVHLRDLNDYLASYKQKLTVAMEYLDILQTQMQGQMSNSDWVDKERQLVMEIEEWSSI